MNPNRPRAGTPTENNLFVLAELFTSSQLAGTEGAPVRVGDASHIRRCLAAGLVTGSVVGTLTLTVRGAWVLAAYKRNAAGRSFGWLTAEENAVLSDEIAGGLIS